MEKKRLRFSKAVSFAIEYICRFPKYVFLPILGMLLISFLQSYLSHTIEILKYIPRADMVAKSIHYSTGDIVIRIVFSFSFMFISLLISFSIFTGFMRMIKKWLTQKEEPAWKDFFAWDFPLFGKYFAVSLVLIILGMIGFFLFIIPGFVILTTYIFAPYVLIDNKGGVRRSFGRSSELTTGVKGSIFWLILLYILLLGPNFYFSNQYSVHNRADLLPYFIIFFLFSAVISQISQLLMIYLYFDLVAQQSKLDQQMYTEEEPLPPLPLEMLMDQK